MDELLKQWIPNVVAYKTRFFSSLSQTMQMTLRSGAIAFVIGLALGVLLTVTKKDGIKPNALVYRIVNIFVNLFRSIPFIILLVMLLNITLAVTGRMTGTVTISFPLTISAFPYVARMVEGSLMEVDGGVIEAAKAMGSSTWQIIWKVLLPEAKPSLINGFSICMTTILGYTTMASVAAGGGLGATAVTYGLSYRQYDIMYAASIMLVVLVQIITVTGTSLSRKKDHRIR